ncbi:MAG: hypothetical protein ABJC74_07640 [Gemmatimonadota bacterium]
MVDDKTRILASMKQSWGGRLTTSFVRQGHYALDLDQLQSRLRPDRTGARIGDLLAFMPAALTAAGGAPGGREEI